MSGAAPFLSSFATRWVTNFHRALLLRTNQAIPVVIRYDGVRSPFAFKQQGGAWVSAAGNVGTLIENKDQGGTTIGWRFVGINNEVEEFDATGRLIRIASHDGRMVSLTNAPEGLVVTDDFGRALRFAATVGDSGGPAQMMIDPAGNQFEYHFGPTDGSGATQFEAQTTPLVKVVFPGGVTRSYEYRVPGTGGGQSEHRSLLTSIQDDGVVYATLDYDTQARGTRTALGSGVRAYSVGAGSSSDAKLVTDPLGAVREYSFSWAGTFRKLTRIVQPAGAGSASASVDLEYFADGQLKSRKDWNGTKTCYERNAARRLESGRIEGLTGSGSCPSDITNYTPAANTPQRKILTQWHPDWRLETRRSEPKRISTTVHNGQPDPTAGNAIVTCAPSDALVDSKPIAVVCRRIEQATSDETGGSGFAASAVGAARITSYTYNRYGQVLTVNGPRTDVTDLTTYEYYPDTQADWTLGDLKQVTNALGRVTRFTRYDRNGRLLQSIDPNGLVTDHQYHPRGWLTQTKITPAGGGEAQTTGYDYDGVGQLKKVTHPDGSTVTYTYDPAHRLTAVEDSAGNRVEYTLDAMGNRTQEDWKDTSGTLRKTLARTIDALNRVQTVVGGAQ
jgi:YD repeat-containing protein